MSPDNEAKIKNYVLAQQRMEAGKIAFNGGNPALPAPEGSTPRNPDLPNENSLTVKIGRLAKMSVFDIFKIR